ncbi:MAG: hypothetical protein ACREM6_11990 [Vulcanimicrobiaceae bacterium]
MTETPLIPDVPTTAPTVAPLAPDQSSGDTTLFEGAMEAMRSAGEALGQADSAEHAFVSGQGGLQEMVFERARADALLSVASSAASKATQSLNTILNMQV